MKIFIDIGHPAHVHYFRNFIKIMEGKGYEFIISARDKEVGHQLLKSYGIEYYNRGAGGVGLLSKLFYFIEGDYKIYKLIKQHNPQVLMSFASPYLAQVSKFTGLPHIVFDDTENNVWNHRFYSPFSKTILTPSVFQKDFGAKQIRFNSYMELCYLHPDYFTPDISVLEELGVHANERYVIMRFVAWNATHDLGHNGISYQNKLRAIKEFKKYAKIFISSESKLPADLEPLKTNIAPHRMHDALAFSSLLFGESATMASESAVLGTPAIYIDDVGRGYTDEEEQKYGLVFNYTESEDDQLKAIDKGIEILKNLNIKQQLQVNRARMLADKIDLTAFIVWFIENYPESFEIIRENPEYQNKFLKK
jgi:hypothetical protein